MGSSPIIRFLVNTLKIPVNKGFRQCFYGAASFLCFLGWVRLLEPLAALLESSNFDAHAHLGRLSDWVHNDAIDAETFDAPPLLRHCIQAFEGKATFWEEGQETGFLSGYTKLMTDF